MEALVKTNNELVVEIHDSFYSAEDRLLQEAKDLLRNPQLDKVMYAERLSKLGFGAAKPVKEAIDIANAYNASEGLINDIMHWRMYYPGHRFITEAEVKKICEKYGLLLGDSANYIGDIPEKNVVEIESFKLRKEDYTPGFQSIWIDQMMNRYSGTLDFGLLRAQPRRTGSFSAYFSHVNEGMGIIPSFMDSNVSTWGYVDPVKSEEKTEIEQAPFKICAPRHEFNTIGYEVKDGFMLVYDPIVLQPVKNGFLIITAWGQEASDEMVVNEIKN